MKARIFLSLEISEGLNKELIEALVNSVASFDDVNLLEVSSNPAENRTVFSFVGEPEAVIEATLNMARAVSQLIDMTRHKGSRHRIGALDLCYFMPVSGITLDEVIDCSQSCALRLAGEIGVPVYLVGDSIQPGREAIASRLLKEDYESLEKQITDPSWAPDFGPAEFVPQWGASMIGARKFLVSFNVNILSTKEQAAGLALNIGQKGGSDKEDDCRHGDSVTGEGCGPLRGVHATCCYSEDHNVAQVETTIADIEATPLHRVYHRIYKDAQELDLAVVGSQIVGVIPLRVILLSADHFIEEEKLFILEEDQKIRLVVQRLGLNSLVTFNSKERVIEHLLDDDSTLEAGALVGLSMKDFVFTVGSRTVTPEGGSVAALTGILGCALAAMTGLLSYGTKQHEALDTKIRQLVPPLYSSMRTLLPLVDQTATLRYERANITQTEESNNPEEQKRKVDREQSVLERSVMTSLTLAGGLSELWQPIRELAEICDPEHRSNLQMAIKSIEAGVWGAHYSLENYIVDLKDGKIFHKAKTEMETYLKLGKENFTQINEMLVNRK